MIKLIFKECNNSQANWGSGKDPREYLTLGKVYNLDYIEVHTNHSLIYLENFTFGFNSVCFEGVDSQYDMAFQEAIEAWQEDNI